MKAGESRLFPIADVGHIPRRFIRPTIHLTVTADQIEEIHDFFRDDDVVRFNGDKRMFRCISYGVVYKPKGLRVAQMYLQVIAGEKNEQLHLQSNDRG